MYKSLTGIAAAALVTVAVMPTAPANAAPIRHAAGIDQQSNVESVQYRRYYRGGYGGYYGGYGYPRAYGYGYRPYRPYRYYGGGYPYRAYPYAYAAPYPYYRRYYGPRPFVGIGPFGFGVW